MNEREAFEAWLVDFKSNAITKRFPKGEYVSAITENYFSVWQAALASQAQQESQWISVEERLPDGDRFVDVYIRSRRNPNFGERKVSVLFTNGSFKFEHMFDYEYVSHWLPLPPAPEGGDK